VTRILTCCLPNAGHHFFAVGRTPEVAAAAGPYWTGGAGVAQSGDSGSANKSFQEVSDKLDLQAPTNLAVDNHAQVDALLLVATWALSRPESSCSSWHSYCPNPVCVAPGSGLLPELPPERLCGRD